jgi:hypothetical protein
MQLKKKFLLLFISLLIIFLLPNYAKADVSPSTIPATAYSNISKTKVYICHRRANSKGYLLLNISVNGLNGHQIHTSALNKLPDEFPSSGVCPTVTDPPITCNFDQYIANNGSCVTCPSGQIVDPISGESCIVGAYPTVNSTSTSANIAAVLTGTVGSSTSLTIRIYDQNGTQKSSGSATIIGTTWSYQAPVLSMGTYEVEAEGDVSHGSLIDRSSNELVVLGSCTQYQVFDTATNQCVDMWNGLPVSEILALNAKWGTENYLGASCEKTNNVYKNTGSVDTEWASCSRPGGVFKSHIQTNNTINYHCLFEVTGSGISGTTHIEKQFDVPANYTVQQKWALINSQCAASANTPPTVTDASTTEGTAKTINGGTGTSQTISSVTLTKIKDGLGATVSNATPSTIGSNITASNNAWSASSGTNVAVGTYTITVTDGNTKTASATLTVTCPLTGKTVATATSCITPTAPTVSNATTTDSVPVNILGTFGTSTNTTNFTVTLTKVGINTITTLGTVSLDPPTANGWKVSSGALTVGTYSIVARDSNLLSSNTATLTVACTDSKVANSTSSSCISAPTVNTSQNFSTTTPVITGTVGSSDALGNPALGLTELFSVTVNNVTYDRNNAALSITGTAWALTIPTTAPLTSGQSYPVIATRDGILNGNGTITIGAAPSVDAHPDTYDSTPTLTGRIGGSALTATDTFNVKINNKTYSYVAGSTTDGSVIVNADLTWKLTIPTADKLTAASYPIEAIRNTLTGTGSVVIKPCALPSVVDEVADTCSLPIPTVQSAAWDSNTTAPRVISGTIGTATALGSDETFAVTIGTTPTQIYTKPNAALSIANSGTWTLTIPTATSILAGTYSVEAARNTTSKNADAAGKLVVRLICLAPLKDVGGKCEPVKPIDPTITSRSTTDTVAATLDGTVGTSTSLVITITDSNGTIQSTGSATISGASPNQTWTYIAPILPEGTYTITVTGDSGNPATGTLDVTSSSSTSTTPKVTTITSDNAFDIALSRQTVSTPATVAIEDTTPTLSGTIGTRVINNDSFSVTISKPSNSYGAAYSKTYTYAKNSSVINLNSTAWSLPVTESLAAGIYEINAVRNSTSDETHNELRIGIDACDISVAPHVATLVLRSAVDGTHYVLGDCSGETKTNPGLYPKPQDLQPEDVVANPLTCPAGSELNKVNVTNATIKRGNIANAVTVGGTVNLLSSGPTVLKYSVLSGGVLNLAGANISADGLSATGVTLTGVTLSDAYIDTEIDFIDSILQLKDGTYLDVRGGVTNSSGTITYEGTTVPSGILTGGIITSGTNVTDNSAARGTLLRGNYDVNTTNGAAILTKGRRVNGTVTGVSISGATVTTACNNNTNPCNSIKTVVEGGTISAGSFSNSPTTQTFGTVVNATVGNSDANITNTNYCFQSGKVGSRGQLNWKEVVQE